MKSFTISKKILVRNLLCLFLLLYTAGGVLYSNGSIISIVVQILYFVLLIPFVFDYVKFKNNNLVGHLLIIFVLLNLIVWGITEKNVYMSYHNKYFSTYGIVRNIAIVMLSYIPFYVMSVKGMLSELFMKRLFILILLVYIANYYSNYNLVSEVMNKTEQIVNNSSYRICSLIPLALLFWKNRVQLLLILFLLLLLVVISLKRGAIITCSISYLIILFYYFRKVNKIKFLLFCSCIGIICFYICIYFGRYFTDADFLIERMTNMLDGDTSGRDTIFSRLFLSWLYSNDIIYYIFGHGIYASVKFVGIEAHNDFLEILTSLGLFGLSLYLIILNYITKYSLRIKNNDQVKCISLVSVSIIILVGMCSMCYNNLDHITLFVSLGYSFGINNKLKKY